MAMKLGSCDYVFLTKRKKDFVCSQLEEKAYGSDFVYNVRNSFP